MNSVNKLILKNMIEIPNTPKIPCPSNSPLQGILYFV